jgi:hypothetical protein
VKRGAEGVQEDAGAEVWILNQRKGCQGGSDSECSPRSTATFQNKIGRVEGALVLQGTRRPGG